MKVVLSARGSRGDVHPMIAIGSALHARGHDVVLCVPGEFVPFVVARGMAAVAYSEDARDMMRSFGTGWQGLREVLAWFSRSIDEQFERLTEQTRDADVLVTTTNEIAAPSVAEERRIPFVRVTYAPMITGYRSNPLLPWQGLPRLANRAGWAAVNLGVDTLAHGAVNGQRRARGLHRVWRVGDHLARYGHTLFSMNAALAPPCPSWRGRYAYSYTGYCFDEPEAELPTEVQRFIADGPPPVFLGLGSVDVGDPRRFTRILCESVARARCRALLGAGWAGLGIDGSTPDVHVVGEADHQLLFPQLAAVVHHGGSGTTHAAARAGVPQLVLPKFADQFYWGHRVQSLGVGPAPVPAKTLTVAKLTSALVALRRNADMARSARRVAELLRRDGGTEAAVSVIEGVGARAGRAPATGRQRHGEARASKAQRLAS